VECRDWIANHCKLDDGPTALHVTAMTGGPIPDKSSPIFNNFVRFASKNFANHHKR
jgi:hypothetical protein